MSRCKERTEVWARCCGYFSPTSQWNKGKKAEFKDRKSFRVEEVPRLEAPIGREVHWSAENEAALENVLREYEPHKFS